jgi:hypothetical protein
VLAAACAVVSWGERNTFLCLRDGANVATAAAFPVVAVGLVREDTIAVDAAAWAALTTFP